MENPVSRLMAAVRRRSGGVVAVLLAGFLVLFCLFAFLTYLGSQSQERLNRFLEEGRLHIQNEKPELAAQAFLKADAEYGATLTLYQKIRSLAGSSFILRSELAELSISAAMLCCYDDFFHMKASPKWVEIAAENLSKLSEGQAKELKQNVETAREVSNLCRLFSEEKYSEVMQGLLAAEKNALPTDQDFFVTEIRILIACGKAMNESDILTQARELLFFLSYEAGVKSKKLDSLWGVLNR